MGFAVGDDLRHEVVVLGLALLVLGPVGVAEMNGAVQGHSLGDVGALGYGFGAVSGGDRPAWEVEAAAGLPDG